MANNGYNNLLKEIKSETAIPCWRLETEMFYQYNGNGDLFSKTFLFRVLEDLPEFYWILIEEQFKTKLPKTYELIDSINDKGIIKMGTAEELGLKDFDIRDFVDDVDKLEDDFDFEKLYDEEEENDK